MFRRQLAAGFKQPKEGFHSGHAQWMIALFGSSRTTVWVGLDTQLPVAGRGGGGHQARCWTPLGAQGPREPCLWDELPASGEERVWGSFDPPWVSLAILNPLATKTPFLILAPPPHPAFTSILFVWRPLSLASKALAQLSVCAQPRAQ